MISSLRRRKPAARVAFGPLLVVPLLIVPLLIRPALVATATTHGIQVGTARDLDTVVPSPFAPPPPIAKPDHTESIGELELAVGIVLRHRIAPSDDDTLLLAHRDSIVFLSRVPGLLDTPTLLELTSRFNGSWCGVIDEERLALRRALSERIVRLASDERTRIEKAGRTVVDDVHDAAIGRARALIWQGRGRLGSATESQVGAVANQRNATSRVIGENLGNASSRLITNEVAALERAASSARLRAKPGADFDKLTMIVERTRADADHRRADGLFTLIEKIVPLQRDIAVVEERARGELREILSRAFAGLAEIEREFVEDVDDARAKAHLRGPKLEVSKPLDLLLYRNQIRNFAKDLARSCEIAHNGWKSEQLDPTVRAELESLSASREASQAEIAGAERRVRELAKTCIEEPIRKIDRTFEEATREIAVFADGTRFYQPATSWVRTPFDELPPARLAMGRRYEITAGVSVVFAEANWSEHEEELSRQFGTLIALDRFGSQTGLEVELNDLAREFVLVWSRKASSDEIRALRRRMLVALSPVVVQIEAAASVERDAIEEQARSTWAVARERATGRLREFATRAASELENGLPGAAHDVAMASAARAGRLVESLSKEIGELLVARPDLPAETLGPIVARLDGAIQELDRTLSEEAELARRRATERASDLRAELARVLGEIDTLDSNFEASLRKRRESSQIDLDALAGPLPEVDSLYPVIDRIRSTNRALSRLDTRAFNDLARAQSDLESQTRAARLTLSKSSEDSNADENFAATARAKIERVARLAEVDVREAIDRALRDGATQPEDSTASQ